MLKMANVELEKISDADIHLFIEKEWEEVLVMSIKDIVEQIMKIVLIMIKRNSENILTISI